jgi:hypothetical protein
MFLPSRITRPAEGVISRDKALSSVDFPQAFGPMIAVKEPSGIETDKSFEIVRSS